ncbi:MAG: PHP domain-containing protein [Spirochaetes bacterium]|nr:PHP domain-containing protein [Spirochaetota bacterium]
MLLKGCLHVHTTCSDGKMTPQQVADEYEKRGYDFIAFTDHDYLLKPNYRELYSQVKSNMIIFTGIELTVFVKGYVHVNKIEGEKEVLHIFNHIGEYSLTSEQILERIGEIAGKFPLDAVEITNKGFRQRDVEALNIKYPMIAADDAHAKVNVGRAWIELDAKRDKDKIIRKIKRGDFWNCYI